MCVFSSGDLWASVRKVGARRDRTESKALFPLSWMSHPFLPFAVLQLSHS